MSIANKRDIKGIMIRKVNNGDSYKGYKRVFKFKTLQSRGDALFLLSKLKAKYDIGYCYAYTITGSII